jgi:NAD(P)-dependent dehydrogenase (short-subunit alcohol dehydrogenase family)
VVNVSSALGSFWAVTNPDRRQFHFPSIIYGSSKAAVSMLTVQYAKALPDIKFNAVEPGFTATDLTPFSGAGQPVEKGAEVIVHLGTTHEVDDCHDHQDGNECPKTDVHRNLLSWIATVGDHPAADYFG